MNNIHIFSYAVAYYKISDIEVHVYFSPAVLEAFYSREELFFILDDCNSALMSFDAIFCLIKDKVRKYKTYVMWYDLIEYDDVKLVWKSSFAKEKNTMYVEVQRSNENHLPEETVH